MDKYKLLAALLVLSLLLNIFSLMQIGRLEDQLINVVMNSASNVSNDVNNLRTALQSVQGTVHQLQREQEWILEREIVAAEETTGPDDIRLQINFSLREVAPEANVRVYYKPESTDQWDVVAAEGLGANTFRAPIKVSSEDNFVYKIALDDQVSEVAFIPGQLYKPQPVLINGWSATGNNIQDVEFYFYQEQPRFEFFEVEELKLRVYRENRLIETVPLRPHQGFDHGYDEHIWEWAAEVSGLEQGTYKVYLEVKYGDGNEETFMVWPDIDEKARYYYR